VIYVATTQRAPFAVANLCLPRRLLAKTFGAVQLLPGEGGTSVFVAQSFDSALAFLLLRSKLLCMIQVS